MIKQKTIKHKKQNFLAQVTLEFIFCFLMVLLIFYSCVKAMQWFGKATIAPHAQHRSMHQSQTNAFLQINQPADFPVPIRLMHRGNIFDTGY